MELPVFGFTKWDGRFIELAKHVAPWSKDPSTKVGCCITDSKNRVISLGYNGFPRGIDDSPEHYEDRPVKLQRTIHAEENAILFANQDLEGCTIYTFPLPPCAGCTTTIIQAGIKRVVAPKPTDEQEERWGDSFKAAYDMFMEVGVEVCLLPAGKVIPIS